jgi:hypothetical protein
MNGACGATVEGRYLVESGLSSFLLFVNELAYPSVKLNNYSLQRVMGLLVLLGLRRKTGQSRPAQGSRAPSR